MQNSISPLSFSFFLLSKLRNMIDNNGRIAPEANGSNESPNLKLRPNQRLTVTFQPPPNTVKPQSWFISPQKEKRKSLYIRPNYCWTSQSFLTPHTAMQLRQYGVHLILWGSFSLWRPSQDRGTFLPLPQDKPMPAHWVYLDLCQLYSWVDQRSRSRLGRGTGYWWHHCHWYCAFSSLNLAPTWLLLVLPSPLSVLPSPLPPSDLPC